MFSVSLWIVKDACPLFHDAHDLDSQAADRHKKSPEPGAVAFLNSVSRKAVAQDPKDFRG